MGRAEADIVRSIDAKKLEAPMIRLMANSVKRK